jgi:hypothetical protein
MAVFKSQCSIGRVAGLYCIVYLEAVTGDRAVP